MAQQRNREFEAIDEMRTQWQALFEQGDLERFRDLHTVDYVGFSATGRVEDWNALHSVTQEELASGLGPPRPAPEEVEIVDGTAIERGRYTLTDRQGEVVAQGHYLSVLKKVDDRWKMCRVITNMELPELDLASAEAGASSEQPPPAPPSVGAHEHALDETRRQWVGLYNRNDAAALAERYTEDAVVHTATDAVREGRRAIAEGLERDFEAGLTQISVQAAPPEILNGLAHDALGYKIGNDRGRVVARGYMVAVWKKAKGEWRVHRQLSNLTPEFTGQPTTD